ncbi:kinase-like protein [Cylindrobasidium torrendii FP15055 ss-10]|uniref:Kinase-like protein n=1 Tax=Cylindrobasidium torrendii FP15055 ss-10 TaxID=1314674 RepID=A0A0D7ATP4_9AGAR|nr:kinase-like protein [Cylindrobasidium torrendii FP15055 ss-10]
MAQLVTTSTTVFEWARSPSIPALDLDLDSGHYAVETISTDVQDERLNDALGKALDSLIFFDVTSEGVAAAIHGPGRSQMDSIFEVFKRFVEAIKGEQDLTRATPEPYDDRELKPAGWITSTLRTHQLPKSVELEILLGTVVNFLYGFSVPVGESPDTQDPQNHELYERICLNLLDVFTQVTETLEGKRVEQDVFSVVMFKYASDLLYRDIQPGIRWTCIETEQNVQDRMDSYQEALDDWPSEDVEGRREALHSMMRLAKDRGIFPQSMYCLGVRVNDWELRGEGGFAHVYKGVFNGHAVAVKVLKQTNANVDMQEELWKRCAKEALLWRQLAHPNIVQCFGVTDDLRVGRRTPLCLIFPWMANGDLRHYIHDRVPFLDDVFPLNALEDISRGLQYLHSHNPPIVHADIRCANVLVKADLSCCISDLGLSFPTEFTLTSHGGDVPGTIRFMAPEVLSHTDEDQRNDYDTPARDVYSFGCLMIELHTAQDPFSWLHNSGQITMALCV